MYETYYDKLEPYFGQEKLHLHYMGKFKIKSPANIWIDELVCLRGKMYAFKCGNYSKNNLKGISKSQSKILNLKNIKNI